MIRNLLKIQQKALLRSICRQFRYSKATLSKFSSVKTTSNNLKKALQQQLQGYLPIDYKYKVNFMNELEWSVNISGQMIQFNKNIDDFKVIAVANVLTNSQTIPPKDQLIPEPIQTYITAFIQKKDAPKSLAVDYKVSSQVQIQSIYFVDDIQQQKAQIKAGQHKIIGYKGPEIQNMSPQFYYQVKILLQSVGLQDNHLYIMNSMCKNLAKDFYRKWVQSFVKFF